MTIDDTLLEPAPAAGPSTLVDLPPVERDNRYLLSTRGLDVAYGPVQVLFDVDFDVAEGEMVALLGTNGAGKSTLLKAVCGLMKPRRGSIRFGGRDIAGTTADKVARAGISLMPGGKGVFPTLTVAENLRLAGWLIRRESRRVAEARAQIEELFPILRERAGQLAGDLSGGEQQMLALGMAMTTRPELLLIDELSLGLAPTVVGQLLEVVREIHRRGTTIVIVEQSVNVALELAERAVFMEKGEVRFEGRALELLERPDILRSVFIAGAAGLEGATNGAAAADTGATSVNGVTGDAVPLDGQGAAGSAESAEGGTAVPVVAVREPVPELDPVARRAQRQTMLAEAPEVLHCDDVLKRFGGIRAVDGTSVRVRKGEIVGLIGHNGAGKTTLLDCISGFHVIDGGRIFLRGIDVTEWAPHERARGGLGRSFQDALLFPTLTVAETVAVARERHLACRDLVAEALRLPASYESELAVWSKVDELVEVMGLGAYREKLTGELSTGTRRIVDLACILAQEPSVLLLDEPSAGVAQRETEALGPLLLRVRDHTDCAIVVVEHDMPLLQNICDQMVALELGAVITAGPPDEVLEHPGVIASYLGTSDVAIARSGSRGSDHVADPQAGPPDSSPAPAAASGPSGGVEPTAVESAADQVDGWLAEPYGAHQARWGDSDDGDVAPPERPRRGPEPATDHARLGAEIRARAAGRKRSAGATSPKAASRGGAPATKAAGASKKRTAAPAAKRKVKAAGGGSAGGSTPPAGRANKTASSAKQAAPRVKKAPTKQN